MKSVGEFLRTVTIPQAIIVLGLIAGGVAVAYRLPSDTLVEVVTSIVVALGVGGTLLTSRKTPERITDPGPEAPPPPPPRRNPRDGSVDVWDLVAWGIVLAGILATLGRSGVFR